MDASIGRGNLKDTDEENLSPSWILVDIVTVGENTVVCKRKPKLQHLLMCHVTTQGMELRMQEGDATQSRNVLDNSIIIRKLLVMISFWTFGNN